MLELLHYCVLVLIIIQIATQEFCSFILFFFSFTKKPGDRQCICTYKNVYVRKYSETGTCSSISMRNFVLINTFVIRQD